MREETPSRPRGQATSLRQSIEWRNQTMTDQERERRHILTEELYHMAFKYKNQFLAAYLHLEKWAKENGFEVDYNTYRDFYYEKSE